jgi:ethanolamine utilization protein EutN
MFLAKIKKRVISSKMHPSYRGRPVFIVKQVDPDGREKDTGNEWVAVDYIGAGIGDIVICGGAPGVAQEIFKLKNAPIRTLIMAIVDRIDYNNIE